ncbi:gamma-glutamyltranspeptidase precursor [bacterium BMS3Abin04]|nr:gamma-glutamyltranspeptidase precursor [bacterium BMS3Abin04]
MKNTKSIIKIVIILFLFTTAFIPKICFGAFQKPQKAKNGMVVTVSTPASLVGVQILKDGGNAVDAAVAVGFALAVTYPYAGNIGGGGFMVIHLNNGKNTTIDFREKAPLRATRDMYLDKDGNYTPSLSKEGATSVGVPGSVAGLICALKRYGTMPLEKVIQPAIDLAEKGWRLDDRTVAAFIKNLENFKKYPSSYKIFSKDGKPYLEGEIFKQPDLAWTLEQIKENGTDGFYKGKVADLLIKQIKEFGGIISHKDLIKYKPVERKPVISTYRGHKIVSMPPPSSGGIILAEMLNILENYHFNPNEWGSSIYYHKLVEAMKYAYADRSVHLGDADFYPVPQKGLLSKEYAKSIFLKIGNKATPSSSIKAGNPMRYQESTETTHYSIYDKYGNAVSVTTTLNSAFGNKIVVEGAGFLLNNEMDDFSSKPGVPNQFGLIGGEGNSIQPEKRMLSSMTPTIILKDGKPYIVIGSPGGSTIITTVMQVILNCIDFNMDIQTAIDMPRIHHQWLPDKIFFEKYAVNLDTAEKLRALGYKLADIRKSFRILGIAEGIMIDNTNHIIYGASDPRGGGSAEGY